MCTGPISAHFATLVIFFSEIICILNKDMHTVMNFIISIHNTVSKRVPFQVRFALDDGDDCAHFTVIIIIIPAFNLQYPVAKIFIKNNRQ